MRYKARRRGQAGAILGVVDLMIMVPMVVIASFLLMDTGLAAIYKQKLSFVLIQAANYAVNLPPSENPESHVKAVVTELCTKSGLKCQRLKLAVKETTIGDDQAISISASADFPLLEGSVLPVSVNLQDTAVALIPANRICAAIAISPYPYSQQSPQSEISVYLPIIAPRHNMPVWKFPYDIAINNLRHVDGQAPPVAPPVPKNLYFNSRPSLY